MVKIDKYEVFTFSVVGVSEQEWEDVKVKGKEYMGSFVFYALDIKMRFTYVKKKKKNHL